MEPVSPLSSLPTDLLLRKDPAQMVRRLDEDGGGETPQKLEEVARQFEGIFLHQILKQMQSATASLEDESEDPAGEQIKSMYWDFWAETLTQRGGVGLWKSLYRQLSRMVRDEDAAGNPQLNEQI
jgi:Rod binding domain-containing protein